MVRAGLPSFRTRPPADIDPNAPGADPVQPLGNNLALADGPRGGPMPGDGALQVYEPGDTGKAWRSAGSPGSFRNVERERARKDNLQLCCKMCVFFVYLLIFTVSMLYEQGKSPARLADHIQATLDWNTAARLDQVSSEQHLYGYIERTFIPAVFGQTIDRSLATQMTPSLVPFDFSNRLLGTVRMRQSRVALRNGCQLSPMFKTYSINCYPPFGSGSEDTADFGRGGATYRYSSDSMGTTFTGMYSTYSPNGYMHLFPTNASDALASMAELRNGHFLDTATRAVFLEFNVWSSNVATYASVVVAAEFGPTGTVQQQVSVMTLSQGAIVPGGLGSGADWIAFIGVLVVVAFNVYFIVEEMQEIWVSRLRYFLDGWNILDWVNMILLMVAFVLRIINFVEAGAANIGGRSLGNNMSFNNLRGIAYRAHMVNLFHAVNGALLWGKAVKYLRFLPVVKEIVHVVWKAFDLFLPFVCMFAVAFIGFAMAYNIGFGDKIAELATFYNAAVYLGRAFLRDIRLMTVYDLATPIFAATLILLYYVTLILVGASFLFAIIADALFQAKMKTDEHPNPYHKEEPCEEFMRELRVRFPWLFRCRCWQYCPCFKRRRKQEDGGAQDAPFSNDKADGPAHAKGELMDFDGSSSISSRSHKPLALPTRGELMRAVELMSGRILSEVAIVGIEIKSELHEICERVAQMQMAVEELTMRAEKVRQEQEVNQLTNA